DVPSFTLVPPIPGNAGSIALGISAGGQYVVGSVHVPNSGYQPFRWLRSDPGVQSLGASAGHILGDGVDISDDGQTVVGVWRFQTPGALEATHACGWSQGTGSQFRSPAAGHAYGRATAASASGSIVVGASSTSDFFTHIGGRWPGGTTFSPTSTGT